MNIKFTIDDKKAKEMFANAVKALNDSTVPLKETRTYQLSQIKEAFNVAGKNIIGESWKKLSPNYLKSKIRSGFLTNILVRTGKLKSSFKSIELGKKTLKISSNVPYFSYHQIGGSRVPRRQILGHSKAMIQKTLDIFAKFIHKKIKNG